MVSMASKTLRAMADWLGGRTIKATKSGTDIFTRLTHPDGYHSNIYQSKISPRQVNAILNGNSLTDQSDLFTAMELSWPRLAKNLNELKRAVSTVSYKVVPKVDETTGRPSPRAIERAKFVEYALDEFNPDRAVMDENSFRDTIYDICHAVGSGISVLEILWEDSPLGKLPRATAWVHPKNYTLVGTTLLMRDSSPVDRDRFLVCTGKTTTGHPLNQGLMKNLGFWWAGTMFGREWFLKYAQNFGQPARVATYPLSTDASVVSTLNSMLENMGSNAWGSFPEGIKLEFIEAAKSGADLPQLKILEVADTTCDILILGQTLTTDVGSSGSRALGDVHYSIRQEAITHWAQWVANVLNYQLIPSIIRLNYGDLLDCPSVEPDFSRPEDPLANAQRDTLLMQHGVAMPKVWFYERHHIPLPEPGEELVEKPAPALPGIPTGQPANNQSDGQDTAQAGPGAKAQTDENEMQMNAKAAGIDSEATTRLTNAVLEDLTGVSERWLGPIKPIFKKLVVMARDSQVSDEEFRSALEKSSNLLPELFGHMDHLALANALEKAMGAAMINGAVGRMTQ